MKKKPIEWAEINNITIIDNDGWRTNNKKFEEPITLDEFSKLIVTSTIQIAGYTLLKI